MVRSAVVYLFIALYVFAMAPIVTLWVLCSGDTRFIYAVARFCLRIGGVICGIRVRIRGLEKLRAGQNYLFLSNHESNADGPVLLHAIPRDVRAVVKAEMMRLPVLASLMRLVGFVPMDRVHPGKARQAIERGAASLREGLSFFAFPEGTRSRDGRLGPFRGGVFMMALKARVPIAPITILHSRSVQPPGAFRIHPNRIEVVFHDPIATDQASDREQLMQMAREAILSGIPESL